MEPESLKRKFGDRLCFQGVLDSQKLLPQSSPEEVLSEARRLIEIMGVDGGLALNANNAFQMDVPVANVLALYDGMSAE